RLHGFRAEKHWRQHHLVSKHEAIDVAVVPVKLKTPWHVHRRPAEYADPVIKFTELLRQAGELAKMLIKPHDIARCFIGACANTRAKYTVCQLALVVAQLCHAEPMPHQIAMDVAPGPPDLAVDIKQNGRALFCVERQQELICGVKQCLN